MTTTRAKRFERQVRAEEAMAKYRSGHDPGTHWRAEGRVIRAVVVAIRGNRLPEDRHPIIGMLDTPELAAEAVRQHNVDLDLRAQR